jgi:hypothetical protein
MRLCLSNNRPLPENLKFFYFVRGIGSKKALCGASQTAPRVNQSGRVEYALRIALSAACMHAGARRFVDVFPVLMRGIDSIDEECNRDGIGIRFTF